MAGAGRAIRATGRSAGDIARTTRELSRAADYRRAEGRPISKRTAVEAIAKLLQENRGVEVGDISERLGHRRDDSFDADFATKLLIDADQVGRIREREELIEIEAGGRRVPVLNTSPEGLLVLEKQQLEGDLKAALGDLGASVRELSVQIGDARNLTITVTAEGRRQPMQLYFARGTEVDELAEAIAGRLNR